MYIRALHGELEGREERHARPRDGSGERSRSPAHSTRQAARLSCGSDITRLNERLEVNDHNKGMHNAARHDIGGLRFPYGREELRNSAGSRERVVLSANGVVCAKARLAVACGLLLQTCVIRHTRRRREGVQQHKRSKIISMIDIR